MSNILVSGSIAYDHIMNFPDQFGKYILPEKTNEISVCFNVDDLQIFDGGAGHGIAYNLALLGEKAILLGAVGKDFTASEFNKKNIDYTYTYISQDKLTPAAHIMTDANNNQITSFYPGASAQAASVSISDVKEDCCVGIVSPNDPQTMLQHMKQGKARGIPMIFDPGQPLPAFSKEQLHKCLQSATYLMLNEYERDLFCKIAECTEADFLTYVDGYIVTLGEKGARYVSKDETSEIPALPVENVVDPTGAGDSFRAGILYGIKHNLSIQEGMQLGTKLAAACIQQKGTQNHTIEH